MASDGGGAGFSTGFLLGGIIGVVVGLLIAPKPGQEMRSELMERSQEWRGRAEEVAARARERLQAAVEERREARLAQSGDTHAAEVTEEEKE